MNLTKEKKDSINLYDDFDNSILNNSISILEWCYKNINSITTNDTLAQHIYSRLIEKGYKEINSAKEELESYNMLMTNSDNSNPERIGYVLISLILRSIKKFNNLDSSLIQFVRIYNERFNKENTYREMMKILNESTNKKVVFVGYYYGERFLKNGILEKVEDYKTVTINGEKYPFIGYNVALSTIYDVDGHLLYSNSKIGNKYNLTDFERIEKLNNETFGENYSESLKKVYF